MKIKTKLQGGAADRCGSGGTTLGGGI